MIQRDVLIDTHCHLNDDSFSSDVDNVLENAKNNEVSEIWDISVNINSSKKSLSLSNKHNEIKSFVGIDPEIFIPGSSLSVNLDLDVKQLELLIDKEIKKLSELITKNANIIGIGETGIDNYWIKNHDKKNQEKSLKLQEILFRKHIELSIEHNLPISLHSRGAEQLCVDILKEYQSSRGIFHSYTGNYHVAKQIIENGFGLGVNGIVTFKNANELRDLYRKILGKVSSDWSPIDFYKRNIFFETDAPFLSPEGKRGERNEPGNVRVTFEMFIESINR